jgi:lipoyl(octanoyl) transferase
MTLLPDAVRISEVHEELETSRWRLISSPALPGASNMAIDETLLETVLSGGPPAVRFYTWQPATLSLGVNQPLGEVDLEACRRRGIEVVRRLTGGRAVLHQHELTYSVVARESDPRVSGGVTESYRKISSALVAGLRLLGADVSLAPPDRALHRALAEARRATRAGDQTDAFNTLRATDDVGLQDAEAHGAVCFDAASDYELTARGRKLVGSAQARRGGALLQHGSILLDVDWKAWAGVFAYRTEEGRRRAQQKLPTRMTSLREELGREVAAGDVARALTRGFAEAFEIDPEPSTLSYEEEAVAARLAGIKYGSREWTARK